MTAEQNSLPGSPIWLRERNSSHSRNRGLNRMSPFFKGSRFRLFLLALSCMILGHAMVSFLHSSDEIATNEEVSIGNHGHVLHHPPPPSSSDISAAAAVAAPHPHGAKAALKAWTHRLSAAWNRWDSGDNGNGNMSNSQATGSSAFGADVAARPGEEVIQPEGHSRPGFRPVVAKCTIVFGSSGPTFERALRTHERHNKLHGYAMHVLRQSIMEDVWSKPAYLLSLVLAELSKPVNERLEWILWIDADTVLLNPLLPIEIFLPPTADSQWDDVHLLVSHDFNGLNNGVFPIRVHPWSVELLSAIMAFRQYRPEEDLVFRDQSAMASLLKEPKFSRNTIVAPQRWFNAYQGEHNETLAPFQVRRGDLLVHFAGVPNRDERMRYWLNRAEKHTPDWEIDVPHTSFPEEIEDFWALKSAEREAHQKALGRASEDARVYWEQVERNLRDHRDRLDTGQVTQIEVKIQKVKTTIVGEQTKNDLDAIKRVTEELKSAARPLNVIAEGANQALMKEAHDAILSAESLSATISDTSPAKSENDAVKQRVIRLKESIVKPEWNRDEVKILIEDLRITQSRLNAKVKEMEVERQKQEAIAKAAAQAQADEQLEDK